MDVLRCAWAILPASLLWGASFPFALAAASSQQEDTGWIVGAVYAANTVGAILGALGVTLIFIPWLGTQQVERLLIALSFCGGLFMSAPRLRRNVVRVAGALVFASF